MSIRVFFKDKSGHFSGLRKGKLLYGFYKSGKKKPVAINKRAKKFKYKNRDDEMARLLHKYGSKELPAAAKEGREFEMDYKQGRTKVMVHVRRRKVKEEKYNAEIETYKFKHKKGINPKTFIQRINVDSLRKDKRYKRIDVEFVITKYAPNGEFVANYNVRLKNIARLMKKDLRLWKGRKILKKMDINFSNYVYYKMRRILKDRYKSTLTPKSLWFHHPGSVKFYRHRQRIIADVYNKRKKVWVRKSIGYTRGPELTQLKKYDFFIRVRKIKK